MPAASDDRRGKSPSRDSSGDDLFTRLRKYIVPGAVGCLLTGTLTVVFVPFVALGDTAACAYRWSRTNHPQHPELRRLLWAEVAKVAFHDLLAVLVLAVTTGVLAFTGVVRTAFIVGYALVGAAHVVVETEILERLKGLGDKRRGRYLNDERMPGGRTVRQHKKSWRRYLGLAPTASPRRYRSSFSAVVIAVCLIIPTVAFPRSPLARFTPLVPPTTHAGGRTDLEAHQATDETRPSSSPGDSRDPNQGGVASARFWTDVCGGRLPGVDAPAWIAIGFYKLYLGEGGPGANVAGCTGETMFLGRRQDFAYVIGRLGGVTKSVAVVSRDPRLPSAIFLSPAAEVVIDWLREDGPLGGSQRVGLRGGDLYLVYGKGTRALVRESVSEPYVALPEAVFDEWYSFMVVRAEWLWPKQIAADPTTGYRRFEFARVADGTREAVVTVSYDPSTTTAFAPRDGQPRPHTPFQHHIAIDDLIDLASS